MKKFEGREAERYQLTNGLSVVYEGATEEIPVRPQDLSTNGMFIHTTRYFPMGSVLKVKFRLNRAGFQVNVRAEVRHCETGFGIGVEFIELPADVLKAIEKEIGR